MKKIKAFTLVELLLSMAIMGIIVGIGGDVFATVIRAYRRAELFGLTEKNGNFILTTVEQDIRSAISVNVAADGKSIDITKPTASGTEIIKYTFSFCGAGNAVTRNGDSLLVGNNPVSGANLYLQQFGTVDPIVRINGTADSRTYDIVYISFVLADKCDPAATNVGYYQTTVNLRGGIQ